MEVYMEQNLEKRISELECKLESLEKAINQNYCKDSAPEGIAVKESLGLQGKERDYLSNKVLKELNNKQGLICYSYFNNNCVSSCSSLASDIPSLINIDSVQAERWFNAFAGSGRIEILKALLNKNCTANELMEICNFSTSGKLYHHLNFFINTGIVYNKNGVYNLNPSLIGSILLMMQSANNFIRKLNKN